MENPDNTCVFLTNEPISAETRQLLMLVYAMMPMETTLDTKENIGESNDIWVKGVIYERDKTTTNRL